MQGMSRDSEDSDSSTHSSRSSSFNISAAEIILGSGLFREDSIAHMGFSLSDTDDPDLREELICRHAQNPGTWVSETLAQPNLWKGDNLEASIQYLIPFRVSEHTSRTRRNSESVFMPLAVPNDCDQNRQLRMPEKM